MSTRSSELNRALAEAGIYASVIEPGSDLESLFLELTGGGSAVSSEGTFMGPAGAAADGTGGRQLS